MKVHEIKLSKEFEEAVLSGEKCFEVRYNDRGYQKGDVIKFKVVDGLESKPSVLDYLAFEITYVLSGWHIEQDYVVFGIRRKPQEADDEAD